MAQTNKTHVAHAFWAFQQSLDCSLKIEYDIRRPLSLSRQECLNLLLAPTMAGKMAQRKQNKYTQNQQGDNGLGIALCLLLFQSAERYGSGFSQSNDRTESRAPTPDIILNTNPAPQLFAGFGFKASGVFKNFDS